MFVSLMENRFYYKFKKTSHPFNYSRFSLIGFTLKPFSSINQSNNRAAILEAVLRPRLFPDSFLTNSTIKFPSQSSVRMEHATATAVVVDTENGKVRLIVLYKLWSHLTF